MNLVIFDFCDTLVNMQTANHFSKYVLKVKSRYFILALDTLFEFLRIYSIFSKLKNFSQKRFLLFGLRGLTKDDLDIIGQQYAALILPQYINTTILDRLKKHVINGDYVLINSGGYEIYLKFFVKRFAVKKLYGTRLKFEQGIFTGKISGRDCLGREKIRRMLSDGIKLKEFSNVVVYSDSFTDKPLFDIADERNVVLYSSQVPDWCTHHNCNILQIS